MNILSFQFEDSFQHFPWGRTSGDELHQVCFVWDSFYFSFISERQLFWKEYSWLAGFSLLVLWVCPWRKAKLLMVAGEPMRHRSFSCDAAVAASCRWFKSDKNMFVFILILLFIFSLPHMTGRDREIKRQRHKICPLWSLLPGFSIKQPDVDDVTPSRLRKKTFFSLH